MNNNLNMILRELFNKPYYKFHIRELARITKLNPNTVINITNQLEKKGLVQKKQHKNLVEIVFNRDNRLAVELKRVENLKIIYESRILELLEEKFPGTTIILFGSYAFGEDNEDSDVDIAIIGAKRKEINLENYEKKINRKIIINFYPSFKEIHKNLKENICNGIILVGGIEL